jgi:translocator protein
MYKNVRQTRVILPKTTINMRLHSFLKIILAIALCLGIGLGSAIITGTFDANWYAQLNLPSWQPPPYLFAPVWTILYILMGISLAIIWLKEIPYQAKKTTYTLFAVQLIFNFLWTILFFKQHLIAIALVDILLLLHTIFLLLFFMSQISKLATWLLVPYCLWVAFATYLNFTIWMMN